jgi:nitrile hydratase beta subunit
MNGVHDMGGMHGFGPIDVEENEPVFHDAWEGRIYGLRTTRSVEIPGGGRYSIERLDPALYLASSYYERWLHSTVQGLIEAGAFSAAEFDESLAYFEANPDAQPPERYDPEAVEKIVTRIHSDKTQRREVDVEPKFAIDDSVTTRNMHPKGHTRLVAYARGKRGIIVNYHGTQVYDDAQSAGLGPHPQPLYSVRFDGRELWGESAEPNSSVHLDMWESYLETA